MIPDAKFHCHLHWPSQVPGAGVVVVPGAGVVVGADDVVVVLRQSVKAGAQSLPV